VNIEERLDRIERVLARGLSEQWEASHFSSAEDQCAAQGHKYKRVRYDLQGGKWGVERCQRCGHEYTWKA
jgi:hypothetical protein